MGPRRPHFAACHTQAHARDGEDSLLKGMAQTKDHMLEMFRKWDRDRSGFIGKDELRRAGRWSVKLVCRSRFRVFSKKTRDLSSKLSWSFAVDGNSRNFDKLSSLLSITMTYIAETLCFKMF